jgi:hypothetical protein
VWKKLSNKYNKRASHIWINGDGDYLTIEKRKLYSKTLWYIDYRYGWKLLTVTGGKHPQEPYHSGTEAMSVAKKFMEKYPDG